MADFEFDGDLLKTALQATFSRRKTLLPADVPAGLSDEFAEDRLKQSQWTAFIRRTRFGKPVVADLTRLRGFDPRPDYFGSFGYLIS